MPASAYQSNIPQANQLLSVSQLDLLNNFGAIESLIDIDHADFQHVNAGKHNRVSLPVQATSPLIGALAFAAGEVGLYSFLNPTTAKNELYINKTNNSGIVQIPATASILGTATPAWPAAVASGVQGWTMLPSGIKLVWGDQVGGGAAVATVTLVAPYNFATTILSVQVSSAVNSPLTNPTVCYVDSIPSANSFTVASTRWSGSAWAGSVNNFKYLAIGY